MAELEILWTPAAIWALRSFHWREGEIIDAAVQLHGGSGVALGSEVELLYRAVRPLRIYEGATEVQQLIIGKSVLQEAWP